ncbi:MAG: hypothetical protein CFE38_08075 [Comamonadaceae bacterium PBBC1]|nr:MAG: hypothetical protein CFE38_08075 [Comamonadaceae bacterium PBBC1]
MARRAQASDRQLTLQASQDRSIKTSVLNQKSKFTQIVKVDQNLKSNFINLLNLIKIYKI